MMFFWSKNKTVLKPRTSLRRVEESTSAALVQLEQREMLSGLNVGDTFTRDSNPANKFEVTGQSSDTKFSGFFVVNGFNIDVSIKCKPNGQFIVKAKNEFGRATIKATPVADSNPAQVTAKGFVKFTGQPKGVLNSETFTLQSKDDA